MVIIGKGAEGEAKWIREISTVWMENKSFGENKKVIYDILSEFSDIIDSNIKIYFSLIYAFIIWEMEGRWKGTILNLSYRQLIWAIGVFILNETEQSKAFLSSYVKSLGSTRLGISHK